METGPSTKAAAAKCILTDLNIKTKLILTQNSITTTTPNMLILIFKYKNYANNRFSKLIPHETAPWCCKMGIPEVYWKS